jgi:G3E family GTPase
MHLTVVSSIDSLCRQQACQDLAAGEPESVVVLHDLLENGVVIRRVFSADQLLERVETQLEHGCLSCTVRLDLVPTIEGLLSGGATRIIVGLPSAVPAAAAIAALDRGLSRPFTIDSAVLACAPDALEDHIWDHHTLFESGFTPIHEDQRTPGEFLLGELCFNDTVLLAAPDIVPADQQGHERGVHLIRELAPHAHVAPRAADVRPGLHHYSDAVARTVPGTVHDPAPCGTVPASPFATVFHSVERPLHPERFRHALATLAEGCCVLRGRLWIASAPDCRIAIQGIGPRVWLENTGAWGTRTDSTPSASSSVTAAKLNRQPERRGTLLAATGEDVDPAEIEQLLRSCELTDAEMLAGFDGLHDPFGLRSEEP